MSEGFVEQAVPQAEVLEAAKARAASLAHLGANREAMAWQKEQIYGTGAALNHPDGAAHMLRNGNDYAHGPRP